VNLISRLFRKGGEQADGEIISIPDDLRAPDTVGVVQGPSPADIWPALFLLQNLSVSFPGTEQSLWAREDDADLAALAGRPPSVYRISGRSCPPGQKPQGRSIVILAGGRSDASTDAFLLSTGARVRVAGFPCAGANVVVRTGDRPLPESLHFLCGSLGMASDRNYRPRPLQQDESMARKVLSPTAGAPTPYIAAGRAAAEILGKSRAEMPLRVVLMDDPKGPVAGMDRATRAAVLAGAAAAAVDSPGLWAAACAFGIPVAGLDRHGDFPSWAPGPSRSVPGFLESWSLLVRRGWGV